MIGLIAAARWRNQLLVRGFDHFVFDDLPEVLRKPELLVLAKKLGFVEDVAPDPFDPEGSRLWRVWI